MFQISFKAV